MKRKMKNVGHFFNHAAAAEAQAILILLFIVLMLAIAVKLTVADNIVAAADRISKYRVWGADNTVTAPSGESSAITITSPADGDTRYIDERITVSGRLMPGQGRTIKLVFYRINGDEWAKGQISGDQWSGERKRYVEGNYEIEAVAYDDLGMESEHAVSHFAVLFRYYADALYVNDNIPPTMIAGDRYPCQITFDNTGNTAWTNGQGYALASYSTDFGSGTIPVPAGGVAPTARNTFSTTLSAPELPGSYSITYRMKGGGYGWFGDELTRAIRVDPVVRDAKVVSVDIPAEMTEGDTYQAKITMRNTGTGTWYTDGSNHVDLGLPDGNTGDAHKFTGKTSVPMSGITEVRPGGEYTFQFQIKAPGPGSYGLKFRMVAKDSIWFGEQAEKVVKVNAKSGPEPEPDEPEEDYQAYVASGNFRLIGTDGRERTNCMCVWCYDGPLVRHNSRSSYVKKDGYADWDIGGPNGQYRIYSDDYHGSMGFSMNNGGNKGTVTFRDK
ncbi:hypothetical protein [Methanocella sp. MCL-LM]|uniref:hypothetical protein n=1 Tax=Methanocella sp. MCL-LM TaxID=3412035 RepID=UPI003C70B0DF